MSVLSRVVVIAVALAVEASCGGGNCPRGDSVQVWCQDEGHPQCNPLPAVGIAEFVHPWDEATLRSCPAEHLLALELSAKDEIYRFVYDTSTYVDGDLLLGDLVAAMEVNVECIQTYGSGAAARCAEDPGPYICGWDVMHTRLDRCP